MPEQFLPEPTSVDFLSSVSRAQRSLSAFILTLVRQAADAEDVLQETNVVLWQKAAEFDTTRPFMPWALRIAHLQAMAHLKRQKRVPMTFDEPLLAELAEETIAESAELDSRRQALAGCLQRLPKRQQEWIARRYQPGGSVNELARQAGKTPKAMSEMLRADPGLRQEYRRWMALHADLYWDYASAVVGRPESSDVSRRESPYGRGSRRLAWTAAALLLVVVTSVLLLTWVAPGGSDADQPVIGRITLVAGTVQVDNGGDMRLLGAQAELRAGASVHEVGLAGLAMLRLDDGTEISLAGETRLRCHRHAGRTTIALHEGNLSASVVSRAADRPLQIHTSNAQISVLGTRLAVSAGAETSQLGVRQGRVQLRRLTDGETIDVGSGQYAVVSQRAALEARPWPTTPETWSEDFEDGLPDEWRHGQWLRNGPAGDSRGIVLAARRFAMDGSHSQLHRITLPKRWMEGLWRLEEGTVLHFTYKMSRPGWFHIMMGVRSDDLNASHVGNYELQSSFWRQGEPDQWQTVSVPFAAFRRNVRGVPYADLPPVSPRAGDVVYLLWFNTGDVDRGLMIDRIWVDRRSQPSEGRL